MILTADQSLTLIPYRRMNETYPSFLSTNSTKCIFNLLVLNFHALSCPSVLLKYALAVFSPGGMYQLPQRSFATSGRLYAFCTSRTKAASVWMLVRRLWIVRVVRLREVRSCEIVACVEGGKRIVLG